MKIIRREEIAKTKLPGRILQTAVGKEAQSKSGRMMVGLRTIQPRAGPWSRTSTLRRWFTFLTHVRDGFDTDLQRIS